MIQVGAITYRGSYEAASGIVIVSTANSSKAAAIKGSVTRI